MVFSLSCAWALACPLLVQLILVTFVYMYRLARDNDSQFNAVAQRVTSRSKAAQNPAVGVRGLVHGVQLSLPISG